jgi:Flp pilus assembly protein TadD
MIVGADRARAPRRPDEPASRRGSGRPVSGTAAGPFPADTKGAGVPEDSSPEDGVHQYQRGGRMVGEGTPAAAATLLARAAAAEPESRSILATLARAQYDAGRYTEAVASFTRLTVIGPSDDYVHVGLGLAASKAGELRLAAEHRALAVAMRSDPMRSDPRRYARALRGVRARQAADSR